MAPGGGGKRKRYGQEDDTRRPSPYKPQDQNAPRQNQQNQQNQQHNGRGQGQRRPSRGYNRGGNGDARGGMGSNAQRPPARESPTTASAMPSTPQQPAATPSTSMNPPPSQATPAERAAPQHAPPSKPKPTTYDYQYLTDEKVEAWRALARQSVVEAAKELQGQGDTLGLSIIFQELIRAGLDGRVEAMDAGTVVKEILDTCPPEERQDSASLFLDCLSILTEADVSNYALRSIVLSTGISAAQMREELDTPLLVALGLVRSTFARMAARKATNLLYRQSNYNLLREETEGYSKLMTEYFTTSNSGPPTGELAAETFQKVKALIGAFDLDVGRVLDVTLDVFANLLVKQYRFFIKLLRASSWWPEAKSYGENTAQEQDFSSLPSWALPESASWTTSEEEQARLAVVRQERDRAFWDRVKTKQGRREQMDAFFELGGRQIVGDIPDAEMINGEQDVVDLDADREWMRTTQTLPPPGNRTAAQLLGFKLRFYASDARDPSDTLPDNLIYLAALLIKIGFISLRDLYPHLYPPDEKMAEVKEKLAKEKARKERKNPPGAGVNLLAMTGALPEKEGDPFGAAPRLREDTPEPEVAAGELPEPADQKIALLRSLLLIGAIPEALFILGRFPWLLEALPDLPEYIHRILHHCLAKVYEASKSTPQDEGLTAAKPQLGDQAGQPKGQVKYVQAPPRKSLRWAKLDKNDSGDGVDYRFYWDDWADNVPVCQNVDDVFLLCDTLLNLSGVKIGQDPTLLIKLARIGLKSLSDDSSTANQERWIELSKKLLVPALSLTKSNPNVVNEIFDLLKLFSTRTRYAIYAEVYTGSISRLEDVRAAFNRTRAETRDVLKRISKTNTKPMARALAKVAYASPGVVFEVALTQIEVYNNLIEVFVECARYFTYYGYDVLTWSLMTFLGGRGKERQQADGMLTSPWLKALSTFAGRVFKRYSVINPSPILQYVAYQLEQGSSTDLEVLEQIITSMAGIRSDLVYNNEALQGMAGGEALHALTLESLLDKRHEMKHSSKRLIKSLVDPGLAGPLLTAIARKRVSYIFSPEAEGRPLKVLGSNLDTIHQVFVQYLDLLRSSLSIKEFDTHVPDLVDLISNHGIDPATAFMIARPSITHAIAEADATLRSTKRRSSSISEEEPLNGVVEINGVKDDATRNADEKMVTDSAGDASEDKMILDAEQDAGNTKTENVPSSGDTSSMVAVVSPEPDKSADSNPDNRALRRLEEQLRSVLPQSFEETLSISFYATFWRLSLYDISPPMQTYKAEQEKTKQKIEAIMSDRKDISVSGMKKKEQQRKELTDLYNRLVEEAGVHAKHHQRLRRRLAKEKSQCNLAGVLLPRMLLSPMDSRYTFLMMNFLHSSGTPGFRTLHLLDAIFKEKQLTAMIFQCTAREAENFGQFLYEVLAMLKPWHLSKDVYESNAYGPKKNLPGFAIKLNPDKTPAELLDYENFRRFLYTCHLRLNSALKACLMGGEYMHIRNAITILKSLHPVFPAVTFMEGDQEDLKLSALSLVADLKRQEAAIAIENRPPEPGKQLIPKEKRIGWLTPQEFRLGDFGHNAPKAASRGGSARPDTPQPKGTTPRSLNAAAAEFQPKPASINGVSKSTGSGRPDAEDGEIEDGERKASLSAATPATQAKAQPEQTPAVNGEAGDTRSSEPKPAALVTAPTPGDKSDASRPAPENTNAESATPATFPTPFNHGVPQRPDMNRTPSGQFGTPRAPHALPNRPDLQQPRGRLPPPPRLAERGPEHRDRRDPGRGPPDMQYGRLDRPEDMPRDSLTHNDRRERSPGPGRPVRARSPERGPPPDRDRRDPAYGGGRDVRDYPDDRPMRPPPRDARPGGRDLGYGPSLQNRSAPDSPQLLPRMDERSRMHGSPAMAPPAAAPPIHPDRGPLINPERARLLQHHDERPPMNMPQHPQDRPPHLNRAKPDFDRPGMNPERVAQLSGDFERRNDGPRSDRDDRRGRGSRPHSPRRADDRLPPGASPHHDDPRDYRRDDRPPMLGRQPINGPPEREWYDEPNIPPTGPRGDRPGRSVHTDNGPPGPGRELFQPSAPPRPPPDLNHGRLNQDFGPPPHASLEPRFGRLNAGPDVPSGPRGRGSAARGGRHFNTPSGPRQSEPMAPTSVPQSPSDRQQPAGPAPDHGPRRPSDQVLTSAPQTPATENAPSDLSGIHPSRLQQIQPPPPIQTDLSTSAPPPSAASAPSGATSSFPPSGPRNSRQQQPNNTNPNTPGVSPITRGPPTGPASAGPGREDKRFAGLHNMLQGGPAGGDRGASIRGRAGRGQGQGMNTLPDSSTPSLPSQPPMPGAMRQEGGGNGNGGGGMPQQQQQHLEPPRPDLLARPSGGSGAGGPSGLDAPSSQDERSSSRAGSRRGERSSRDGERGSRRHRSRSRSPRREQERGIRERDGREPREHDARDKRGAGDREGNRDGNRDGSRRGRDELRERGPRESGPREPGHRERRERGMDDGGARRGPPPGEYGGGPGPGEGYPPPQLEGRNGDGRPRGPGGERRDERERREGRDARKRGRLGEEGPEALGGDSKRPRRMG
ncbi:THO2 plays a role in transcriptional elongation [Coniosporium tulheliwenetii]|uniref:THO2 plays a role in transcriptional elongation n=1 Tax=Coniosporium tulheliwenetii TaxID=3383036 RepID=A0ACC2Z645_9PEZI|nr:THO2 plays a role in transcriptional elongation [Cladosporium sp. JES 115]